MTAYLVARHAATVYVRVDGLANMKNAPVLDEFLAGEIDHQVQTICVDLSECAGMDSTFMGLLVGVSSTVVSSGGRLVVVNPTTANHRLLTLLGVIEVLPVVAGSPLPDLEFVRLEAVINASPMQRMYLIQRAHEHLSAINEANQAKFATFLTALDRDLVKLRTSGGGAH